MLTALACLNDLMFLSKIMEATKALSIPLRSLKSADALVAACRECDEPVVFLDLDDPRLDAIALARAVRAAEPKIEAAGPAQFDQIFSRGQFVRVLPELLGPRKPR